MRKKLLRLEAAFQVVRHITGPYVQTLLLELDTMLAGGGVATGAAGSRSVSSSSEGSQGDGGDGCGFFYFGEVFQDAEVQTEAFEVNGTFGLAGVSLVPSSPQVHGNAAAFGLHDENSHCVDNFVDDAQVSDSTEAGDLPMAAPPQASDIAGSLADDAAGVAGRSRCRLACRAEPAVLAGGPVGVCCHRLTAARGGAARGAGWPGGGPTGSQDHDTEDEHNQKSIKEDVFNGTTAGADEAAGNGDPSNKEEAESPLTGQLATAPCGSRVAWADTEDSEAEFDDNMQGGTDGFVGAEVAPGGLLARRGTVKVRGALPVVSDSLCSAAARAAVAVQCLPEQLAQVLSDLSGHNPNIIINYQEATGTLDVEFELPRVSAVACGLLAEPDADSEEENCEVVLDKCRLIAALSTAKGQRKLLARFMLDFMALVSKVQDPILEAERQPTKGRQPTTATGPLAAVPAAAAGPGGQSKCRPSRGQRRKITKKRGRQPQSVHPVGDRFFWAEDRGVCRVRGRGPDNVQGATYTVRVYYIFEEEGLQYLDDTTDEELDFERDVPHHELFEEGSPQFDQGYRLENPHVPWDVARAAILRSR
jgi:hypothetical protein